jgi:hypothetical protein
MTGNLPRPGATFRDAIDSVLDVDAFNREVERAKEEAARLEGLR